MKKPQKIVIIRTDRLGDVIISTPVIANVRKAYPNAYIAFICRPYTQQVLQGHPDLNEVIVYDKYGKHKSLWSTLRFAWQLRKKHFDLAIILHPTNRAHLISFVAGIPQRVGWNRKLGFLLTKKLTHKKQQGTKHELEYTLELLSEIGIPTINTDLYFPTSSEADAQVASLLSSQGILPQEQLIVVHPAASCVSKRWPQDYFVTIIQLLQQRIPVKIAVITSQAEAQYADTIAAQKNIIDLRGKLDLLQLGALLKRAQLFISNDSGPVHIAAALKTPVISIFGRKDPGLSPKRWRPWGKNAVYLHQDSGCQECLAHNCQRGFVCLQLVTPELVLEHALQLLAKGE